MDQNNNKPLQQTLMLRPEVARGAYSNLAIISHSKNEFTLDFAAVLPGMQGPEVVSRIVMTPEHAKRLLAALQDNVGKYENQFGTISLEGAAPKGTFNLADFGAIPGSSKS